MTKKEKIKHCPQPDVISRHRGESCLASQQNNRFLGSTQQLYAPLYLVGKSNHWNVCFLISAGCFFTIKTYIKLKIMQYIKAEFKHQHSIWEARLKWGCQSKIIKHVFTNHSMLVTWGSKFITSTQNLSRCKSTIWKQLVCFLASISCLVTMLLQLELLKMKMCKIWEISLHLVVRLQTAPISTTGVRCE